jgi:hypothetical protein
VNLESLMVVQLLPYSELAPSDRRPQQVKGLQHTERKLGLAFILFLLISNSVYITSAFALWCLFKRQKRNLHFVRHWLWLTRNAVDSRGIHGRKYKLLIDPEKYKCLIHISNLKADASFGKKPEPLCPRWPCFPA